MRQHCPIDKASLEVLREPFPWLARNLARVLDRIPPNDGDNPVRTNNLIERGFRELRRRTRHMDGFGSNQGPANFHLLWMLKENGPLNGRDYLTEIIPYDDHCSCRPESPSMN